MGRFIHGLRERRESFQTLAPLLWNSFGVLAILLQEITAVYSLLSPPNITMATSNRVCSALALLECIGAHPETKWHFINAYIPVYIYPFMRTRSPTRPFEHLRLNSWFIIGALVKDWREALITRPAIITDAPESSDLSILVPLQPHVSPVGSSTRSGGDNREQEHDPRIISFLLSTGIVPYCLDGMEIGSELSKMIVIFIVQKILLEDVGLAHICKTRDQISSVSGRLRSVVEYLSQQQNPSQTMLSLIIRCYLRLSDHPSACIELRTSLPGTLRDAAFCIYIDNVNTKAWLRQLLYNVYDRNRSGQESVA